MKLSTQEEYGLRCLLQIGRHEGLTAESLTIAEIGQAEGLSVAYVGKFPARILWDKRIIKLLETNNGVFSSHHSDPVICGHSRQIPV